MSKNDSLLKKVDFFEKLSLYGDRSNFLKKLSQVQPTTPLSNEKEEKAKLEQERLDREKMFEQISPPPKPQATAQDSWNQLQALTKEAKNLGTTLEYWKNEMKSNPRANEIVTKATDLIRRLDYGTRYVQKQAANDGLTESDGKSFKNQLQALVNSLRNLYISSARSDVMKNSAAYLAISHYDSALSAWEPKSLPQTNSPATGD